jgi:hypothetical protein
MSLKGKNRNAEIQDKIEYLCMPYFLSCPNRLGATDYTFNKWCLWECKNGLYSGEPCKWCVTLDDKGKLKRLIPQKRRVYRNSPVRVMYGARSY